jgi:ElaB/YqjD/DUF883 family membrane-anchored ribosome-binding protein
MERSMASKRKTTTTIGEIQNDLYSVREDVAKLADHVTELLGDKSDDVIDEVKQRVSRLRENIDAAITEVGAGGRTAVRDARDGLRDIGETLEDSLRERPFTMLALAVGLGVVVGTTLRR